MQANLYYFNPTCELAVGNGSLNWQPNKLLQQMEADLSILPMFFATSDDVVLVENIPSDSHVEQFRKLGIDIPEFISKKEAKENPDFQRKNWKSIQPWGWSPAAHKWLSPFKENCSPEFKASPIFSWKPDFRELYSKKFSLGILSRLITEYPNDIFMPLAMKARVCNSRENIEEALANWGQLMVKAPWSSSGRGLQPISKTPVHPKVWEKLLAIINDQAYAMAEPLLNKKLDIALQFKAEKQKIQFIGISNFTANAKGQYLGNNLNGLPNEIEDRLLEFAQSVPLILVEPLIRVLESSEIARSYEGYFGVDALIYEDSQGHLKINPCLEINLRYNMGLLSIQLERYLAPGAKGIYRTWFEPGQSYSEFKKEMEQKHPVKMNGLRLVSGFLSLTDPLPDSKFGAYILV